MWDEVHANPLQPDVTISVDYDHALLSKTSPEICVRTLKIVSIPLSPVDPLRYLEWVSELQEHCMESQFPIFHSWTPCFG